MGGELVRHGEPVARRTPEPVGFDVAEVAEAILRQILRLDDYRGTRVVRGAYAALQRTASELSLRLPPEQREEFMRACGFRPPSAMDAALRRDRIQREKLGKRQIEMLLEFARRDAAAPNTYSAPSHGMLLEPRKFEFKIETLEALEERELIEAHPESGNRRYWNVATEWRITDAGRKKAAREQQRRDRLAQWQREREAGGS